MYRDMKGWGGAYRLLNASGAIGSQGPDDPLLYLDAPLVHLSSLDPLSARRVAVLLPVRQSADFVQHWLADSGLQQRVQAVLIDDTDAPSTYSTLGGFPWAEYAPYTAQDYVWNTAAGSHTQLSLALTSFPAPVFLLSPGMAADARQRADYNSRGNPDQQQYHVRLKLTMTAGHAANSSACIAAGVCKPLGGYSVWSALPPLPPQPTPPAAAAAADGGASSSSDSKPIVLVVAQMDAMEMFHDAAQGADAPLSGLIAMLGALHAFKAVPAAASSSYSKRLVFLALAGEPWSYMGSRRLLYEAATGSNATAGLDLSLIEQVVEVGQVGTLQRPTPSSGAVSQQQQLFVHSQKGGSFGDASTIVSALSAAAQQEAATAQVTVTEATASNPGIPPSSLMSFLRVKPSIRGVVLTEFDSAFINPFYASRFDNDSSADAGSIAATAAVLAAALHRLAGGDPQQLQVNTTDIHSTVSDYLSCIVASDPGFACPLVASLMLADYVVSADDGSRSYAPKDYVSVLQWMPDLQAPLSKGNLPRFLWNVMALATASGQQGAACDPFKKVCPDGQVCAGWRASGGDASYMGHCVNATVRYVPSYSTKLECESCDDPWEATWRVSTAADAWNEQHGWPADPMWTESDWPNEVPDLQLYLHESPAVESGLLVAGALITALVGAASYAARVAFARHQAAWSRV